MTFHGENDEWGKRAVPGEGSNEHGSVGTGHAKGMDLGGRAMPGEMMELHPTPALYEQSR